MRRTKTRRNEYLAGHCMIIMSFINPVRAPAQKPNATGSYANAANLERYMPQSGQLT